MMARAAVAMRKISGECVDASPRSTALGSLSESRAMCIIRKYARNS